MSKRNNTTLLLHIILEQSVIYVNTFIRWVLLNRRRRGLVYLQAEYWQSVTRTPHAPQCNGFLLAEIYLIMNRGSTSAAVIQVFLTRIHL